MIQPRKLMQNAEPYSLPKEIRAGKIRLDKNESGLGCSPAVLEALRAIAAEDVAMYPEYPELMRKLAANWKVGTQNIMLSNGADEAIRYVVETFIDPGDEVILPVPTFAMFEILFRNGGSNIKEILYNADLSFPTVKLLNSISEAAKAIIIVSPNSPTGSSISREDLLKILNAAPNTLILLDETYSHFTGESAVDLINDFPNLFILKTFSKIFGLAGLRLGNVISNEDNITNLNKVRLPYCVNSLAVIAACAALDDQQFVEDVVQKNRIEKEFLQSELEKLGLQSVSTDTNFILVRLGKWRDRIHSKLKAENILLRNMREYPLITDFLRISTGTREQHRILIEALKAILPPEVLLFDMDGVLVDVSNSYRMVIKKTAEHFLGETVSFSEIQEFKNRGGYNNDWDLTEALIQSRGRKVNREEIIDKFQQLYRGDNFNGLITNESWLCDADLLENLALRFKLGIVTGRPREEAQYVLRKFKVEKYFDVVVAMEDVPEGRLKPDPFGLNLALEKSAGKRATYLGDTIDDMKAAQAAGVLPIGVISESNNSETLVNSFKQHGAKYILKNVNEIVEVWSV